MNKTLTILKTEFINTVTRRSFILTLILVPLVPALILGGISLFGDDQPIEWTGSAPQPQPEEFPSEGYLDLANIITQTPEWLDEALFIPFDNQADARQAVLAGEISGFFVIQPDYMATGAITYYSEDFNPMSSIDTTWMINALIQFNLFEGDQVGFEIFQNPIQANYIDLSPEVTDEGIDMSNPIAFYIPYGMTMLFYVLIVTSASLMMNSVAKEKENRVMEILVSSVKPRELLTGKILGLGLVGLLQLVVWLGSALLMLHLGGRTLQLPPDIRLSSGILL
ncbi:MAG: ABC transporter permease, partial [Brevefilum sp.]